MSEFEIYVQKLLPSWNESRESVYSNKKFCSGETIFKWAKSCECVNRVDFITPKRFWEYKSNTRPFISKNCRLCEKNQLEPIPLYSKGLDSVIQSKSPPN